MQGTEEGRTGADTRGAIKPLIKPVLSEQPTEFKAAFFVSATGSEAAQEKISCVRQHFLSHRAIRQ